MHKTIIELPEIILVGITCRTNNAELFESTPQTSKIVITAGRYFQEGLSAKIPNRKNPGTTFNGSVSYNLIFY